MCFACCMLSYVLRTLHPFLFRKMKLNSYTDYTPFRPDVAQLCFIQYALNMTLLKMARVLMQASLLYEENENRIKIISRE